MAWSRTESHSVHFKVFLSCSLYEFAPSTQTGCLWIGSMRSFLFLLESVECVFAFHWPPQTERANLRWKAPWASIKFYWSSFSFHLVSIGFHWVSILRASLIWLLLQNGIKRILQLRSNQITSNQMASNQNSGYQICHSLCLLVAIHCLPECNWEALDGHF